jgi:nucleoside-diphosphate-sugar epimerase
MRVLIIGCGYVGRPLGAALVRAGHEVIGLQRSAADAGEIAALGIRPVIADITRAADLADLPGPFDWAVNCVSSTRGGADVYRQVYLEGTDHLIARLGHPQLKKYVHLSSTSVYGQADGTVVTEESPTEPASETSRILVETERRLLAACARGFPAVVLRLSGIYGPDRGFLYQQFLRGEARLNEGGARLINMIHRDDAVAAIIAALERAQPGEVFNVTDDAPVPQRDFFQWLAETLNRPLPPAAAEGENLPRKRGLTNKRVSNARLKMRLGWQPKYPTYREGFAEEMAKNPPEA